MSTLTEGLEDYLEAVLLEEREQRFVRTKHIARRLGVTSPSVHAAMKELASLGLVKHESYSPIELTTKGRRKAERIYSRHRTLYQFFSRTLRLTPEISEASACGAEHHLDADALKRLAKLLDFLDEKTRKSSAFAAELKEALGGD
jgi:DtxR family Mn-dependent transcriptional regulator